MMTRGCEVRKSPLLGRVPGGIPHPARPIRPFSAVYGRVHQASSGVYLLVSPRLGPNDPITAVGWARNNYWAVQIWVSAGRGYRNECDPLEPAADAPSLESLGWPHPLSYAGTLAQAQRLSKRPVMASAGYRMTDGGFTSCVIHAAGRVSSTTTTRTLSRVTLLPPLNWV